MTRGNRRLLVALAWTLAIIVAIAMFVGFAYFFVPIAIIVFIVLVAYGIIAHTRTRNPLQKPPHGAHERWADGQPLGRSDEHELEVGTGEEREERLAREEEELRRHEHENEPPGEMGPPPHVPFP